MDLVGMALQFKASLLQQQISMRVLDMSLESMKVQGMQTVEMLNSSVDVSNLTTSGRNFDLSI